MTFINPCREIQEFKQQQSKTESTEQIHTRLIKIKDNV